MTSKGVAELTWSPCDASPIGSRVVTPRCLFAMPECRIALLPGTSADALLPACLFS